MKEMIHFDLHMHSNQSGDGQFTPAELVQMLKKADIQVAALSDHDTVKGVPDMMVEGKKEGIQIIPAIECSTLLGDYDVHVLGYGINLDDPYFQTLQENIQKKNDGVFHQRVEKLRQKYGVEIDEEKVVRDANGTNPWFIMMTRLFQDPRYQNIEDFKDYIPGGKRSDPAPVNFFWDKCMPGSDLYVKAYNPDFKETIQKIHEANGLVIIAHPYQTFYKQEERLQYALDCGIDGLEAYSNYHQDYHNEYYEQFAREHNLLITCGSDFHGEKKPSIRMGEYGLHKDGTPFLESFLKALEKE